jgi:8-oxo-dGTP pyrophosphatase MutT (NUDIX family)
LKDKNRTQPRLPLIQYAALPVRASDEHGFEVLLITSRHAGRWIIPKGWPKRGLSPHGTAAAEAFEEAGVVGEIAPRSIGSFTYQKWIMRDTAAACSVDVFLMHVTEQLAEWPEQHQRRQQWCVPGRAAGLVDAPELSDLIRAVARRWSEPRGAVAAAKRYGLAK